ncbi:MAG: glycosyltransferase, partial [Bryobacteraceae bacterium]
MNAWLVLFHAFVCAVLLFVWLNSLANLFLVRRLRPVRKAAADAPFVSILVPARNEARRIVRCLRSLGAQRYPHFEVVLLDDAS